MSCFSRGRVAPSVAVAVTAFLVYCSGFADGAPQSPFANSEGKHPLQMQLRLNQRLRADLRAMVRAEQNGRFYGIRSVEQKSNGKRVLHTETVWKMGPRTRVEFAEPPFKGQVIVDDGQERLHYLPKLHVIRTEPGHRDNLIERFKNFLKKNNLPRATVGDGGAVAGHQTDVVTMFDRDNKATQQLWVDPQTGVVLRRMGFNAAGERVAFFEYKSIAYNRNIAESTFRLSQPNVKKVTPLDELAMNAKNAGVGALMIQPGSGFVLTGSRTGKAQGIPILISFYRGPRGRLTVLILKAKIRPAVLERRVPAGQISYTFETASSTVVLIGPYSREELEAAASSR